MLLFVAWSQGLNWVKSDRKQASAAHSWANGSATKREFKGRTLPLFRFDVVDQKKRRLLNP